MAAGLARTIASVAQQGYPSVEYIVVDGGSTDDSTRLIRECSSSISAWVSEPDCGIYDAMNKGLAMARGEWVLFLNSGDSFSTSDTLSRVFALIRPDDDLVYGDALVRYPSGSSRLASAAPPSSLLYGMICSHQALIARRTLLAAAPFTVGKIRSDYEFLLACWKGGRQFHRINTLVAEVEAGGVSDHSRILALMERAVLLHRAGLMTTGPAIRLVIDLVSAAIALPAKKILPMLAIDAIRRWKLYLLGPGSARG